MSAWGARVTRPERRLFSSQDAWQTGIEISFRITLRLKCYLLLLSLFASTVHVICSGLRFKIDRALHSLATAAFRAHSDELEGCPTGTPGSSMPKSAKKSSSSDTYFAFNFVPNIVCEFPMVIPFELAVWMTADATRMPVGREVLVFNRKWVLGGWGKAGLMMSVMNTWSYQSL